MGYTGIFTLKKILPDSGYIIRPDSARLWPIPGIIAEIKRSCDPIYMKQKVKTFVFFYKDALDPDKTYRNSYSPVKISPPT